MSLNDIESIAHQFCFSLHKDMNVPIFCYGGGLMAGGKMKIHDAIPDAKKVFYFMKMFMNECKNLFFGYRSLKTEVKVAWSF